jgi:hypothetical protein
MPPKVRIRRFGVVRLANVFALMYVVIVAIIAVPILLILLPMSVAVPQGRTGGVPAAGILAGGVLITLLAMVFYGIFAWIFGALFALAYNLASRWTGGIEVEVDRFGDVPYSVPPGYGPPAGYAPPGWSPPGVAPSVYSQPAYPEAPREREAPMGEPPRRDAETPADQRRPDERRPDER